MSLSLSFPLGSEQQVANEEWLIRYPSTVTEGGLEASVLGLRFPLDAEHFDRRGKMQVTCTASVGRMRIDGRTRLNISSADSTSAGSPAGESFSSSSAPKQRSLILDSRSAAAAAAVAATPQTSEIKKILHCHQVLCK